MFRSNDESHMTLGELISLCYEELSDLYSDEEELNAAVMDRLSQLLGEYEAEVL